MTAEVGIEEVAEGVDTLAAAADVADAGIEALAASASDLTGAVDAEIVAGRLVDLSQVVVGAVLADESLEELAAADVAGEVARDLAAEGVAKVAEGA